MFYQSRAATPAVSLRLGFFWHDGWILEVCNMKRTGFGTHVPSRAGWSHCLWDFYSDEILGVTRTLAISRMIKRRGNVPFFSPKRSAISRGFKSLKELSRYIGIIKKIFFNKNNEWQFLDGKIHITESIATITSNFNTPFFICTVYKLHVRNDEYFWNSVPSALVSYK